VPSRRDDEDRAGERSRDQTETYDLELDDRRRYSFVDVEAQEKEEKEIQGRRI
jgi:hypothetical protein